MKLNRPHEECGIFGIYNHQEASNLTYLGLYALQHRGQEACGIVSSDGHDLHAHKGMGLVADVFGNIVTDYTGTVVSSTNGAAQMTPATTDFVLADAGVKTGDTFGVYRNGKSIGAVVVTQVRNDISACDIKRASGALKIGDGIK